MPDLELRADVRTILGKKVATLRRQGITPANIFGHNIPSQAIQVPTLEMTHLLRRAGATNLIRIDLAGEATPRMVLVRSISRKPTNDQLLHVDLYQVSMTERTVVEIPLVLTGTSPAVADGLGLLYQQLTTIAVECLPADIPNQVELDISTLVDTHSVLHVSDIALPPNVSVAGELDRVAVSINVATLEAEPEAAAPAAAEEAQPPTPEAS